MFFVFFDVEALFVPSSLEKWVPVTEIASMVVDKFGKIVEVFHVIVNPQQGLPETPYEDHLAHYVTQHVTGLSRDTITTQGMKEGDVIRHFRQWCARHRRKIWLARDPTLENRILRQYRCHETIVVREVLDYIASPYREEWLCAVRRPLPCKHQAQESRCRHHDHVHHHCAMMDIMEEYLWIGYSRFLQQKKNHDMICETLGSACKLK